MTLENSSPITVKMCLEIFSGDILAERNVLKNNNKSHCDLLSEEWFQYIGR